MMRSQLPFFSVTTCAMGNPQESIQTLYLSSFSFNLRDGDKGKTMK
jgi:hypothetical protein